MSTEYAEQRKARILVVDDHPIVRLGLIETFAREPDLEVCADAENSRDAVRLAAVAQPDLVLIDICLPGESGLALIAELSVHCRTVALSMYDEDLYARRAIQAGAKAYVGKYRPVAELLAVIRDVLAAPIDADQDSFITHRSRLRSESPVDCLSNREIEVFRMVGQGLATRDIATVLHVSHKTVETHRENIKKKLGLRNANELMIQATTWVLEQRVTRDSA